MQRHETILRRWLGRVCSSPPVKRILVRVFEDHLTSLVSILPGEARVESQTRELEVTARFDDHGQLLVCSVSLSAPKKEG